MTREIHVWETYEICLRAKETYENPYTDVVVWAVLYGPDFHKKCMVSGMETTNSAFGLRQLNQGYGAIIRIPIQKMKG